MDKHLNPDKAFPPEVLEVARAGVGLPTWYAGPLYTGNGSAEALKVLGAARDEAEAAPVAASDDEPAEF